MHARHRDERLLAAIRKVLDRGEQIVDRGRCWGVERKPPVPLLLRRRRRYDIVLTDRRVMLFSRRSRRVDDVALVKRFGSLELDAQRRRPTMLQQQIHTDTGRSLVLEWGWQHRRLGATLASSLAHARHLQPH